MANEVRKVILLPRYTTLVGAQTFETAPLRVRDFDSADIAWWRGPAIETGGSFSFVVRVQQSPDLTDWFSAGASDVTVGEDSEVTAHYAFKMDWARVPSEITAGTRAVPSGTCWGVGTFLPRREEAGAGEGRR